LTGFPNSCSIHQEALQRWGGGPSAASPRPLEGPAESAPDDNPHLTTRPFCLQGLRRSTYPHGNGGRAVHTMWVGNKPSAAKSGRGRDILGECSILDLPLLCLWVIIILAPVIHQGRGQHFLFVERSATTTETTTDSVWGFFLTAARKPLFGL